jgi:hypothetical protein
MHAETVKKGDPSTLTMMILHWSSGGESEIVSLGSWV